MSANWLARREFLARCGVGLGAAALSTIAHAESPRNTDPLAPRKPPLEPRAKHIIYIHMIGGPSQLDLFDPKPALIKYDGKPCPDEMLQGKRFAFIGAKSVLGASPYKFRRHGNSGKSFSELVPHLARIADETCTIHSMRTDEINHAPGQLFLHTGFGSAGRPSLGSWITYGLGSESRDLPAYVVLQSGVLAGAGAALWSSAFLPGAYQGVQFRSGPDPVFFLSNPKGVSRDDRRHVLDAVRDLNRLQLTETGDPEIETRIDQYELAFRMQTSVPELMDISREKTETLKMYGAQPGLKASFANNCLLARRLIERGTRIVELYDSDWDHHADISGRLPAKCKHVDQASAALVKDLKSLGLLDKTLVVWSSEFGRTAMRQGVDESGPVTKPGRDHQKDAFTIWLAGGGTRAGLNYGKTDDFGMNVTENPVHVHDLNATILHLLGLDHERLTFRYQGRDFRLTDVHGSVVKDIIA
jgi:Protein of unknown function (DUF1501)